MALAKTGTVAAVRSSLCPFRLSVYVEQKCRNEWQQPGQRILASFDDDSVIVYQAYKASIADAVVARGDFVGCSEFSFSRMSWIKPNFLWMMYRSGWGTKKNQERTLALRLRRSFFDEVVTSAVASSFGTFQRGKEGGGGGEDRRSSNSPPPKRELLSEEERKKEEEKRAAWAKAVDESLVRLQWDPDHTPTGQKTARRAIQLGLRGAMLARMCTKVANGGELLEVIDLSPFVDEQREFASTDDDPRLVTPTEDVYPLK